VAEDHLGVLYAPGGGRILSEVKVGWVCLLLMDDDPLELGDAAFQPGSALCDASNIFAISETLDGGGLWVGGRRSHSAR
jgi:hypothetical protein